MPTLKEQVEDLQHKGEQVKARVAEIIEGLEDNPRIKRAGSGTLGNRTFTMSSRHLAASDDWTPAHHNFKYQHELLLKHLQDIPPQSILDYLADVTRRGKIRRSSKPGDTVRLHPDVIRQIRGVLET